MKTPITKKAVQDHMAYSSWKYILLAVIAVFAWNIFYSMTAYRPPEEKKITLGVYSYSATGGLDAYAAKAWQERFPEMEEVSVQYIVPDSTYGDMILSTRIAARECDIYMLPRQQFQSYAAQGGFMAIEEVLPELTADMEAAELSLSRGWRVSEETNEKHLFGIPCASLPGMDDLMQVDTSDMYLSIFFETGNNENCIAFFEGLVRDMMTEPNAAVGE